MEKVILHSGFGNTTSKNGEEIELFSLEEVINYPNITQTEIDDCRCILNISPHKIVGFAKQDNFSEENPKFIQIYDVEVHGHLSNIFIEKIIE